MRCKKDVESVMFDITAKYDGPAKESFMCYIPIIVPTRADVMDGILVSASSLRAYVVNKLI